MIHLILYEGTKKKGQSLHHFADSRQFYQPLRGLSRQLDWRKSRRHPILSSLCVNLVKISFAVEHRDLPQFRDLIFSLEYMKICCRYYYYYYYYYCCYYYFYRSKNKKENLKRGNRTDKYPSLLFSFVTCTIHKPKEIGIRVPCKKFFVDNS